MPSTEPPRRPGRRDWLRLALGGAAGLGAAMTQRAARADEWPSHAIKLVVPFPAGTSPDVNARLIAEPLSRVLGQAVFVDNRPGAGGNLGTAGVAHARADGYTLLFTIQGPLVTAPLLVRRLSYDPTKDFAPVTLVATSPNVLVVDPSLGAATLPDFVRIARQRRGELNYASIGVGSASHLAMELFKTRAGFELQHVPYQGFPQIVTAILAGEVQAAFMVPSNAIGQVRAGRLRALGVTTPTRSTALPDIPSFAEQGYAGVEAVSWQAVLAPAGTPARIVDRLSDELANILRDNTVRSSLLAQYFSAAGSEPGELAALMKVERERWGRVIRAAGVEPE